MNKAIQMGTEHTKSFYISHSRLIIHSCANWKYFWPVTAQQLPGDSSVIRLKPFPWRLPSFLSQGSPCQTQSACPGVKPQQPPVTALQRVMWRGIKSTKWLYRQEFWEPLRNAGPWRNLIPIWGLQRTLFHILWFHRMIAVTVGFQKLYNNQSTTFTAGHPPHNTVH